MREGDREGEREREREREGGRGRETVLPQMNPHILMLGFTKSPTQLSATISFP